MVITIQFQTAEELKWMEPLMKLLKKANLKVGISPNTGRGTYKTGVRKMPKLSSNQKLMAAQRLHGSLKLPADFNYKEFLADSLAEKYLRNG